MDEPQESTEILNSLARTAKQNPFATAIVTDLTTIDYKTLDDSVWALAGIIGEAINSESLSTGDGTSIAIRIRNPVIHFLTSLSLLRMGCTHISIADDSTLDTIYKTLDVANVVLVICEKKDPQISAPQLEFPREMAARTTRRSYPYNLNSTAILIMGSGTTGQKKLIPLTFKNLDAMVARGMVAQSIAAYDRHLCLSPIFFCAIKRRMYQCLLVGATAVFREDIRQPVLKLCRTLAVNRLSMVAPHAHALTIPLVKTGLAFPRLPSLQSIDIGSAPISEELRADLKTYISPNLHMIYATNEFGPACYGDPATLAQHPGTIGKPCDGVEIETVDDDGQPCKTGEIGNIRLKAVGMFEGYVEDVEASRRALQDGWYYPGDMASMTEDGAVIFMGRSDDLIIFNGINIYPREIEIALEQHPAVQEASAFPFRGAGGVELPGCAVILKTELEVSILEAHCKEILGVCRPRIIDIVEDFPRNAAGKILKKELAADASRRAR